MAKYCDSQQLEHNWFHWIISSKVACLEEFRKLGLLWTKVIGKVLDEEGKPLLRHGKTIPNPSHPTRIHCIALAKPIFLHSENGIINEMLLPPMVDLNLLSDSLLHDFDKPLIQLTKIIPQLQKSGFIKELPTSQTWHAMLNDINKICKGITLKFKQKTLDDQNELTHEAMLQVIYKLVNCKLVYTPGRAPVFNLLTTTIHRIMYSIMNKRKLQRDGLTRLFDNAKAGTLPKRRSLYHPTLIKLRK